MIDHTENMSEIDVKEHRCHRHGGASAAAGQGSSVLAGQGRVGRATYLHGNGGATYLRRDFIGC